jgi:hypothetical protein
MNTVHQGIAYFHKLYSRQLNISAKFRLLEYASLPLNIPGVYSYSTTVANNIQLEDLKKYLQRDLTDLYTRELKILLEHPMTASDFNPSMMSSHLVSKFMYPFDSYTLVIKPDIHGETANVREKYLLINRAHERNCKCRDCKYIYLTKKYKTKYLNYVSRQTDKQQI